MKDITIGPRGQLLGSVALVAVIGGAIAVQMPEIQRYLKVRSM